MKTMMLQFLAKYSKIKSIKSSKNINSKLKKGYKKLCSTILSIKRGIKERHNSPDCWKRKWMEKYPPHKPRILSLVCILKVRLFKFWGNLKFIMIWVLRNKISHLEDLGMKQCQCKSRKREKWLFLSFRK